MTSDEIGYRLAAVERIVAAPVMGQDGSVSSFTEERERRMRRSIEAERGAAYTDAEWGEAKTNLVAFFGLLAELDLKYSKGRR